MVTETKHDDTGVIDAEFTVIDKPQTTTVALYDVNDSKIAELKAELTGISDYQSVSKGIQKVRAIRIGIEARRKELKADSIAWGRRVDSEAKRITEQLEAIEEPLKLLKQAVDEAKEAAKKAEEAARIAEVERRIKAFEDLEYAINPFVVAEMTDQQYRDELELASVAFRDVLTARVEANANAEAARLQAIADEAERNETLRIEREVFEAARAALAAERAEYEAKQEADRAERAEKQRQFDAANAAILAKMQADIDESQRIEREAAEKLQAERDEANRIQAEAMIAERAALKAERDRIAKEDLDRQAKIQAEVDERKRIEEEAKAEADRVEQKAAEALRLEALKPDIEKIRAFGDMLRLLCYPICTTDDGKDFIIRAKEGIDKAALDCEDFEK